MSNKSNTVNEQHCDTMELPLEETKMRSFTFSENVA